MTVPARPRRLQECSYRAVGSEGGLVVLPGRSEVKVLNPVAILVFSRLDGEHTVDEIVHEVLEAFDVDEARARADVRAFLEELAEHGMLDVEPTQTPEETAP
jgi:hypothetical protein